MAQERNLYSLQVRDSRPLHEWHKPQAAPWRQLKSTQKRGAGGWPQETEAFAGETTVGAGVQGLHQAGKWEGSLDIDQEHVKVCEIGFNESILRTSYQALRQAEPSSHAPREEGLTAPCTDRLIAAAAAKSLQSCPTLCDPRDSSPPGSPVPGILQARTLEWVATSFSNAWKWKVKVKSLSRVWLLATTWTAAYQAPLSMGFSRQEYWSGVPLHDKWCQ